MGIKGNILWMGCPNAIVGHLAGKQGVISITFDINSRQFVLIADNFSKQNIIKGLEEVSSIEKREFTLNSYIEEI